MKLGTIVTCNLNIKWIVSQIHNNNEFLCHDFLSQKFRIVLAKDSIVNIEENNIEWLFLKRREKENKDIKQYI